MHGEGSGDRPFDERRRGGIAFAQFRDGVVSHSDHLYGHAHSDLRWYSEQFAEHLTQSTFDTLDMSDQRATHSGATQLFDIYRRLVFTFTNPDDFTDGATETDINRFASSIAVTGSSDQVNMQQFIYALELKVTFLLACSPVAEHEGRLAGMSYAERFKYVWNFTRDLVLSSREEDS